MPQGEPGLGVEPGFLVAPAYDSGWVGPAEPQSHQVLAFHHGLGTTDVFVYVTSKMDGWLHIHQRGYGGDSSYAYMWWGNLTDNDINVWIGNSIPPMWEYIRVQIWRISEK